MIMWKPIDGYSNYVINQKGEVMNVHTNRVLKQYETDRGYLTVNLSENGKYKTLRVHRLVAELFRFNPDNKPEVNHIDGNKQNNHHSNLEWVTRRENRQHALDMGLDKNVPIQVLQFDIEGTYIRSHESMTQAAKSVNGKHTSISDVCKGKQRTHKGFIWKYAENSPN